MSTQLKGKGQGQIQNDNLQEKVKSSHEKTTIELERGKSGITMQGGYLYPIMFKEVLTGEYIKSWNIDNLTRILTPLVPTLDRVYITIKAYFVPHTRVWESAESELAAAITIAYESDTLGQIPNITIFEANTKQIPFKKMLVSRYGLSNYAGDRRINALLPRGYRAIINDFVRNKEYETKQIEWKTNTVGRPEQDALNGFDSTTNTIDVNAYRIEPAQTRKGYLTNIKRSIAGDADQSSADVTAIAEHLDWQARFQDTKQRIDNANKNDWDILAEMGGTQPVKADRVEFLGEIDYELNYQQITQSSATVDNQSPLGTTGSFSYTRANGELFSHKQFQQHGFIHILASLSIDKGYEEGTPKELMKMQVNEIYRPGLAKKEMQLIKAGEIANTSDLTVGETAAFQPAWAEYKRLPKFISGDMRTQTLTPIESEPQPISQSQWHNFPSVGNKQTIDGNYFRPYVDTGLVLQRNNILIETDGELWDDPIINMSEHNVVAGLPIVDNKLKGVSKAEENR